MAYTLLNLQTDIRGYTEVDNNPSITPIVFTDTVLNTIIISRSSSSCRKIHNIYII